MNIPLPYVPFEPGPESDHVLHATSKSGRKVYFGEQQERVSFCGASNIVNIVEYSFLEEKNSEHFNLV